MVAIAVLVAGYSLPCAACDSIVGLSAPIPSSEAGTCSDVDTDNQNCGTCGHSCLGQSCRGGQCQPKVIATARAAGHIAVDAQDVYFTDGNDGAVRKCPVAGCSGAPATLFSGANASVGVTPIAVQGGQVFFGENQPQIGFLYACPVGGCGASPTEVARVVGGAVSAVATDTQTVYWVAGTNVYGCSLSGCGAAPSPVAPGADPGKTGSLAVSNGSVCFAANSAGVMCCNGSSCAQRPVPSTGPANAALGVGLDATHAFWTTAMANEVVEAPLAGPASSGTQSSASVFSSVPNPQNIAVDAEGVYFTSAQSGGEILGCPVSGCPAAPTIVASDVGGVGAIAVVATHVYAFIHTMSSVQLVWYAR